MDAHKLISFYKSGFRLGGCAFGCFSTTNRLLLAAFVILFLAEIIGIIEEMVV